MSSRLRVFDTSVGTKILIGLTGFALFLYLIIHIAGNLLVFFGPDAFNGYSHTLDQQSAHPDHRDRLLLIFLIHIYKTVRMFLANQKARPVALRDEEVRPARRAARRLASSTMILSGLWLLVFVVIHVGRSSTAPTYETAERRARPLPARDGELQQPADGRASTCSAWSSSARTCGTASRARSSRSASTIRAGRLVCSAAGKVLAVAHRRRLHRHRGVGLLHGRRAVSA